MEPLDRRIKIDQSNRDTTDTFDWQLELSAGLGNQIDFILIKDQIKVVVKPDQGIGIDFEMQPITIGPPGLFSITGADGQGGPQLLLSTFADPGNPEPVFRERQFKLSAAADILGINPSIDVEIREGLMHFEIKDKTFFGSKFDLAASITGTDPLTADVSASGSASVGIDKKLDLGPLGSVDFDDTIDASLGFGKGASDVYAHAEFGFTFAGTHHDIAQFNLDIDTGPFADMPGIIIDKIEDLLKDLLKDAKIWLKWVKDKIIQGFETLKEIGEFLAKHFAKTAKEVAILMKDVGYVAHQVLEVLLEAFGMSPEEADKIVNFLFTVLTGCVSGTALIAASV